MAEERLPNSSRIEIGVGVLISGIQLWFPNAVPLGRSMFFLGILIILHGGFPKLFTIAFWDAVNRLYAFVVLASLSSIWLVAYVATWVGHGDSSSLNPSKHIVSAPVQQTATSDKSLIQTAHVEDAHTGSTPTFPLLKLLFKDSPLLTPKVQDHVTKLFSWYAFYLNGLDIAVPADTPAIGTTQAKQGGSSVYPAHKPRFYGDLMISKGALGNDSDAIGIYSAYVFSDIWSAHWSLSMDTMAYLRIQVSESEYFQWSFLGVKNGIGSPWANVFWKIRSGSGQKFTDRLVAFTMRTAFDTPPSWEHFTGVVHPGDPEDAKVNAYIYQRLQDADHIIDNDYGKLPMITEIVKESIDIEDTIR